MALETKLPDALAASANYTAPVITDIDEDPASSDGVWLAWDGNGNTDCLVSFPTPTGPPNLGAGLQTFRALIRKTSSAGSSTTWSLELWEAGVQVAVLATGTTTALDPGEVVSGTWNASLLSSADGSGVECKLLQTGGGTGGTRRGIEVGAVAWDVDYNSSVTYQESGTLSAIPSLVAAALLALSGVGVASSVPELSGQDTIEFPQSDVLSVTPSLSAEASVDLPASGILSSIPSLTGVEDFEGAAASWDENGLLSSVPDVTGLESTAFQESGLLGSIPNLTVASELGLSEAGSLDSIPSISAQDLFALEESGSLSAVPALTGLNNIALLEAGLLSTVPMLAGEETLAVGGSEDFPESGFLSTEMVLTGQESIQFMSATASVQTCPNKVNECLPCDESPVLNLTAEAGDVPIHLGYQIFTPPPPIKQTFGALGCQGWVYADTQEEADELARVVCPDDPTPVSPDFPEPPPDTPTLLGADSCPVSWTVDGDSDVDPADISASGGELSFTGRLRSSSAILVPDTGNTVHARSGSLLIYHQIPDECALSYIEIVGKGFWTNQFVPEFATDLGISAMYLNIGATHTPRNLWNPASGSGGIPGPPAYLREAFSISNVPFGHPDFTNNFGVNVPWEFSLRIRIPPRLPEGTVVTAEDGTIISVENNPVYVVVAGLLGQSQVVFPAGFPSLTLTQLRPWPALAFNGNIEIRI